MQDPQSEMNWLGWERKTPATARQEFKIVAGQMGSFVRNTLGPFGLDKMIVRRMEDDEIRALTSNDGIAIIEEFEGETDHPFASFFIDLARQQESSYNDGVTTTVLLASELLSAGLELIGDGVPVDDVVEGFSIGGQRTLETWNEQAISLADTDDTSLDRTRLRSVARSGMTNGKFGSWQLEPVTDILVDAVLRVSDPESGDVDLSRIKTVSLPKGNPNETRCIPGLVTMKEPRAGEYLLPATGQMLLVDGELKPRSHSSSVTIEADGYEKQKLRESRTIVDAIATTDAVLVVVSGDVTDNVAAELQQRGTLCLRNVKNSEMEFLAELTGATISGSITPSSEVDGALTEPISIGYRRIADEDRIEIQSENKEGGATTVLAHGGTESAADEVERRVKHGLNALRAAIMRPEALPGGGAAELIASNAVRELAPSFAGKEQLAVEEFAEVLDSIPQTLAYNAGLDQLDAVTKLRADHQNGHDHAGISRDGRPVKDVVSQSDALDAFLVKSSGLVRAIEFTTSLLKIDDVIVDRRPPSMPTTETS